MTVPGPQAGTQLQGLPIPTVPAVELDGLWTLPWYRVMVSLWLRTGAAVQTTVQAVYLQLTGKFVTAWQPYGPGTPATELGTVVLTNQPGGAAEIQSLGTSPWVFYASGLGTLVVDGGKLELSRDSGVTWISVGLVGGTPMMLAGDQARVTWFGAEAPPVVWLPVAAS